MRNYFTPEVPTPFHERLTSECWRAKYFNLLHRNQLMAHYKIGVCIQHFLLTIQANFSKRHSPKRNGKDFRLSLSVKLFPFSRSVSESRCKVSFTIHQKSIFCDETTYFDDETKKEGIEKGEIGYQDLKSKQHLYVITS